MNCTRMILRKGWIHPIYSAKLSSCKMASTAKNLINSVPHTAATTFAFSSVFNLLLCYILSSTYQSWLWLPWPSLSSGESQEPVKPPRLKKLARQQSKQVNRIIIIILIIKIIIYLARQQSKQVNRIHCPIKYFFQFFNHLRQLKNYFKKLGKIYFICNRLTI